MVVTLIDNIIKALACANRARRYEQRTAEAEACTEVRRQSHAAASTSQQSPFFESQDAEDRATNSLNEVEAEQQDGVKTPAHELLQQATPRSTFDSIPSLIPSDINLPEQVPTVLS